MDGIGERIGKTRVARDAETTTLVTKTVVALSLGIILVIICCCLVDGPVAWFVHEHASVQHVLAQWTPLVSNVLNTLTLLAIIATVLWWAWKPGGRLQTVLLATVASLVVTAALKLLLKWSFGRDCPEVWIKNHPTSIGQAAYSFHPFHPAAAYLAFPSGHAALLCSVLSILWICYPRWRWVYAIVGGAMGMALVGMNYHFVGDVIAGTMLGSITGVYMAHLFRLQKPPPARSGDQTPGNGACTRTAP